jgi:hypothetical protein
MNIAASDKRWVEGDVSADFERPTTSLVPDQAPDEDDILGPEEAYKLFDLQARAMVGMSGEELARRWDAGEYRGLDETPLHGQIIGLMMLRPRGRAKSK